MATLRESALRSYDCLVLNKDKHPNGMGLSDICTELKLASSEKASVYFGLKELAKQNIILYGTHKNGREKLFTIIDGKDAGKAIFQDFRKRKTRDNSKIVDEFEESRKKAKLPLRTFDDEDIKKWMVSNASTYKSYDTLACAAAVKFNRYVYAMHGKVEKDTYPEWILEFAKRVIHPF